jgi:hypothetical protein
VTIRYAGLRLNSRQIASMSSADRDTLILEVLDDLSERLDRLMLDTDSLRNVIEAPPKRRRLRLRSRHPAT